jgi:hypothetical protein
MVSTYRNDESENMLMVTLLARSSIALMSVLFRHIHCGFVNRVLLIAGNTPAGMVVLGPDMRTLWLKDLSQVVGPSGPMPIAPRPSH